jgi:hypothetical protein
VLQVEAPRAGRCRKDNATANERDVPAHLCPREEGSALVVRSSATHGTGVKERTSTPSVGYGYARTRRFRTPGCHRSDVSSGAKSYPN